MLSDGHTRSYVSDGHTRLKETAKAFVKVLLSCSSNNGPNSGKLAVVSKILFILA